MLHETSRNRNVSSGKSKKIKRKNKIKAINKIPRIKEILKHKLQLKKRRSRRHENRIIQMDLKKFYRVIGKTVIEIKKPPSVEDVQNIWENI